MIEMNGTKFYEPKEIAVFLNVTRTSVYKYLRTGLIKSKKFNKTWFSSDEAVKEYLQKKADKINSVIDSI